MRRIGGAGGVGELTARLSRGRAACARAGLLCQRVSTVVSSGESNMATGEITGSSIGTLSP